MEIKFNTTEKQLFDEYYERYYQQKPNKRPWNRQYLNQVVDEIIEAKSGGKKSRRHYYLLQAYDIVTVNSKNSVIKKVEKQSDPIQHVVPEEEIFDKLREIHINCGHGSRDKMLNIIHRNSFIPRPCVDIFLRVCEICQMKKNKSKIKPMLSESFITREQIPIHSEYVDCGGELHSEYDLEIDTNKNKKTKIEENSYMEDETMNIIKDSQDHVFEKQEIRDQFDVFGEFVANELRTTIGVKKQLLLKKRITDVIFELKLSD